jgi:hypothetical protein
MSSVAVLNISLFRNTDVESWITSDGRVYFVQLIESDEDDTVVSHWEGTQTDANVRFFCRHRSPRADLMLRFSTRLMPVVPDI